MPTAPPRRLFRPRRTPDAPPIPADRHARVVRGARRFGVGDYAGSWEDLEYRFPEPAPGERWDGRELAGALLLDGTTEGFGDTIQGLRFAAEARRRVGTTILYCPAAMATLAARCEGVDVVATALNPSAGLPPRIAPLSLAGILAPRPADWRGDRPYLSGDPGVVEEFRRAFAAVPGRKVGIAWQGNPAHTNDANRSFPLAAVAAVAEVPGVTLLSLQKNLGVEQLDSAPFPVEKPGDAYQAGDWLTTANLVSALDLVIAPDSAIAHLAGALGIPAWIALPRNPDWRWGEHGTTTPWYASARLFRQPRPGDWRPVFTAMADALASSEEDPVERPR